MPNWCYTSMTITGNEDEIKVLNDNFSKAKEFQGTKSDFSGIWLGKLVEYLGVDYQKVSCKGSIINYNYVPGKILVDTETAWQPLFEPILMMVEKFAPNSQITYYCEEPGCEIYLTNDSDRAGKFVIDSWDERFEDDECIYELHDRDDLKEWLEELLNKKDGFSNLLKKATDEYEFCVHQFEYCELCDY